MQRIQQALEVAREEGQVPARDEPGVDVGPAREPDLSARDAIPPLTATSAHDATPATNAMSVHDAVRPAIGMSGASVSSTDTKAIRRRSPVRVLSPQVCERNRLKLGNESDEIAQAYRVLRTRVLQWLDTHARNTVAMISAGEGDGKTLSAVNLALSIANDTNHTVLLVDFDLRSPSVHRYLELDATRGVERYFAGDAAIADLLVCVGHPRLAVLPCVVPVAGSSELLAGNAVRDLVTQLKSRYADRIILFDLPPALLGDDAIAFLPLVDAALVVIGEGATRRGDLVRLADVLTDTPVVGSILNRATQSVDRYYG
jgi:protein-tyrosine kinase